MCLAGAIIRAVSRRGVRWGRAAGVPPAPGGGRGPRRGLPLTPRDPANVSYRRIYEVDFNRAYIPYCYYNPTYECPYPAPENRLKIPIRAGEKMK